MHRTTLNRATSSERNVPNRRTERADVMLTTERALMGSLGALRIAIEGARSSDTDLPNAFLDRALDFVTEAGHAAADMMAWARPHPVRPVACSVAELVTSLRRTLGPELDGQCHFIVEGAETPLFVDGRLMVTALERSIRRRLDSARQPRISELMVHAHVEDGMTTISVIDGSAQDDPHIVNEALSGSAEALADSLVTRDCERIGGRVSIHETGGHRCMVVVFPSDSRTRVTGQEASA